MVLRHIDGAFPQMLVISQERKWVVADDDIHYLIEPRLDKGLVNFDIKTFDKDKWVFTKETAPKYLFFHSDKYGTESLIMFFEKGTILHGQKLSSDAICQYYKQFDNPNQTYFWGENLGTCDIKNDLNWL